MTKVNLAKEKCTVQLVGGPWPVVIEDGTLDCYCLVDDFGNQYHAEAVLIPNFDEDNPYAIYRLGEWGVYYFDGYTHDAHESSDWVSPQGNKLIWSPAQ